MSKEQTLEQLRKIIDETPIDPNMTFGKEENIIDWESLEGSLKKAKEMVSQDKTAERRKKKKNEKWMKWLKDNHIDMARVRDSDKMESV
jgi:hypothetical protein